MDPRVGIAAVGGLGIVALVLGLAQLSVLPVVLGGWWLFVAAGFVYAASAAVAWVLTDRGRDAFGLSLLPAVLAPVVTVVTFAGGDVVALLTPVPGLPTLSLLAVVFGMALSFPLGAATRARQQWLVVGLLALAAVPLVLAALSALTPGPPEDRDLIVLLGMVVLTVAPLPTVPTYALGWAIRDRVDADGRSPYPPLVAAAMPFVLALAGFVAAPYFASGTIFGPWLVVLPAVALLAIGGQVARVRAARGADG